MSVKLDPLNDDSIRKWLLAEVELWNSDAPVNGEPEYSYGRRDAYQDVYDRLFGVD